jgi:hypothetical protein
MLLPASAGFFFRGIMSSGQFRPLTEVRMTIKECTEARYDEMLGVLPPAHWTGKGFLVGEPSTHANVK